MQIDLQQLKRQKPKEGGEYEEKNRSLIGDNDKTIDGDHSSWSEDHWDIKSTELRRLLQYQVSLQLFLQVVNICLC